MAFYEFKNNRLILYRYISANHGIFSKSEIVISGKDEFYVKDLKSNDPVVNYFKITDSIPSAWLRDIEVDW
jgi:hypothetical protein